jgi:CCR4-NOT transcription complex subunit 4
VVNKSKAYNHNGPNGPSYSAYISYSSEMEASIAILAIDNIAVDEHILRASYGTTKYCTFFLKNSECPNKDCLYLHHIADDNDLINRDELNSQTNIFYEQQLLAMKIADIFHADNKKKFKNVNLKKKCIFPTTDTIYTKDIVMEQNNEYIDYSKYNENTYFSKNKKKYKGEYDNYKYYDDEEESGINMLQRETSENFTVKLSISNASEDDKAKFISKSKSPMANKKKIMTIQEVTLNTKTNTISLSPIKNKHSDNKYSDNTNSDKTHTSSNENSCKLPTSPSKRLFSKRDHSRFSFVSRTDTKDINNFKPDKTECDLEVPEYVCDVISKKISIITFFKKLEKEFEKENYEYSFFKNKLNQNDSWSNFILANFKLDEKKVQK